MAKCHPYKCKDIPYKVHSPGHEKILQYYKPRTREELKQILKTALEEKRKVCVISGDPDFQRCFCASDNIVSLRDLELEIKIVSETRKVTVGAAVGMGKLQAELANVGLSLPSQSIDTQLTVGEAFTSCLHSSGSDVGVLSSYAEQLEVMTSSGELLTVTRDADPELLRTLGVGLGKAAVVLTVTMTAIRSETLVVNQYPIDLHQLLECFAVHCSSSKYFSFSWFPYGGCVVRHCRPDSQEPKMNGNGILRNFVYGICETAICWTSWLFGSKLLPIIGNRLLFYFGYNKHVTFKVDPRNGQYCGPTCLPSDQYYTEAWFIPRNLVPLVMFELKDLIETERWPVHRVAVSLVRADDLFLSPASGTDSAAVSISVSRAMPRDVFSAVDKHLKVVEQFCGQNHVMRLSWQTYLDNRHLSGSYPRYDDFGRVCGRLDPSQTLVSPYLTTDR